MKNKYLIPLIVLIFIISLAVRYWPVYQKGFSYGFSAESLILARNLSLTGEYRIDNGKNIILSSELIEEQGTDSSIGNKLTPVLYGKTFNLFGFNRNIPLIVSLFIYGIVSVLLFLLVLRLFNVWIALLFSFIEIFSPLVLQYAVNYGLYEWAILFLIIAVFIYLWKEKPNIFRLLLAGLFLALASLARNSFIIIPLVFVIFDFFKNKSLKRSIILVLPVLILWGIYLAPGFLQKKEVDNSYFKFSSASDYMHLFPDPYTWHFEKDVYAESIIGTSNYDYNQVLLSLGYPVSFKNRVLMYWASIKSYPLGVINQTTIGGPIMVFLMILGGFYLYKENKRLLILFVLWAILLYGFLIIEKSNNWGHFMGLQFPVFLLISLGVYWIVRFILGQKFKAWPKTLLIAGIIGTLFIHLIQSDKWTFHERYLYSNVNQNLVLVKSVKEMAQEVNKKIDVIAVGFNNQLPAFINWYTDFNCVYFDSGTIEKLLKENKLQWAFNQFGVTMIVGYDRDLTEKMARAANIRVLGIKI